MKIWGTIFKVVFTFLVLPISPLFGVPLLIFLKSEVKQMQRIILVFVLMLLLSFIFGCNKLDKTTEPISENSLEPDSVSSILYTLIVENYDNQVLCNYINVWVDSGFDCNFGSKHNIKLTIDYFYQSEETNLRVYFYDPILPPLEHTINTVGVSKVYWKLSSNCITIEALPTK